MRGVALIGGLVLTACATQQASFGAGAGEEWIEVRTEHFRVRAQLPEAAAVEAAHGLEARRAGVVAYWGPHLAVKDRLDVIVYRDAAALADFVAPGFIAQLSNGPAIITSREGLRDPAFMRVQAHQIAHHVSAYVMSRQPRWLSEGLAQYLETFELDTARETVTFGRPPGSIGPADLTGQPVTLTELWEWTTEDGQHAQKSAWAWWLVDCLASTHAERFDLWQRAIARGEEPKQAWNRSFAGLTDAALEAEILGALQLRQLKFGTAPYAFKPGTADVFPLAAADMYALRAELLLTSSPADFEVRRRLAVEQLDSALAADPRNADALVLKARLIPDPAAARAFAQRLVQVLPQSAKAWGLLASLLGRDGEDPRETLQFALALEPDHPGLLNTLAWYSTLFDDKAQGLKLAEKAAALRPWSAAMVDTHAAVLGATGRCQEAAARQKQALDMLVHGSAAQRAQYVARLREYETQCSRTKPTALRQ